MILVTLAQRASFWEQVPLAWILVAILAVTQVALLFFVKKRLQTIPNAPVQRVVTQEHNE
jgi:hypothetical protein